MKLRNPERRERRRTERAARLAAQDWLNENLGPCICPSSRGPTGGIINHRCPRHEYHLAYYGEHGWRCRECDAHGMAKHPPATCPYCGSTSGWHPATTKAVAEERIGHELPPEPDRLVELACWA